MFVLGWIVAGLIVGAIAQLLAPRRSPDAAAGAIVAALLGIAGALIAGYSGQGLGWYGAGDGAGYVVALLGAVLVVAVYRGLTRSGGVLGRPT
jgi:uncharacterized membrane protein YeaQ/YmgE (transglycosylase-associated protein family)